MSIIQEQDGDRHYTATLLRSARITPEVSREEVRHLVFRVEDLAFDCRVGQSIRVLAPGQFGNRHHSRLYSIADPHTESDPESDPESEARDSTEFALCVRRCDFIDEFNGEKQKGVASNYLCDLKPGERIEFTGPVGLAFPVPENRAAAILMIGMGTGIAPFRAYIRHLYDQLGGWEGKVRLFFGARTGLEMLYMNLENDDLALYYDRATFKAFQAVSPRPHVGAPIAIDEALEQNAAEVWAMIEAADTHVFVGGSELKLPMLDKTLSSIAESEDDWARRKGELVASGRWAQVIY